MPVNNVCKFPKSTLHSPLTVSCFVLESDPAVMRRRLPLENHRLLLVMQGQGRFFFEEREIAFAPGSLVIGFAGETFWAEPAQDVIYSYVDFGGGRAEELFCRFDLHRGNRSFSGYDGLIPLWRDSLSRANGDTVDLAAESILLYTFSRLCSQASAHGALVGRLIKVTEERFNDPELSLSAIADEFSYNAKYLSHVFREAMGQTYSEYLRTLRVKYAISLFNEGLDSVKNVALLSGFSDPLYFSNVFKKSLGISPREYLLTLQKS